ncbi:MAG: hypothetical protein V1793_00055 [Pseudomonadota bacterium]
MTESNETPNSGKDQNQLESRRKVLRKLLIGGGVVAGAGLLPDKWTKPVVDFVVVPAHAQTSGHIPTPTPTPTPL